LSESVAHSAITPTGAGMNTGMNSPSVFSLPGSEKTGPKPLASLSIQIVSASPKVSTIGAA
jgi:hypothetical protein